MVASQRRLGAGDEDEKTVCNMNDMLGYTAVDPFASDHCNARHAVRMLEVGLIHTNTMKDIQDTQSNTCQNGLSFKCQGLDVRLQLSRD